MATIILIIIVCIIVVRLIVIGDELKKDPLHNTNSKINSRSINFMQNEINRHQQQLAVDEAIRHNQSMMDEMNNQQNQWAMEESRRSVTPFEMGGYDMNQGNSFNNNFNNF